MFTIDKLVLHRFTRNWQIYFESAFHYVVNPNYFLKMILIACWQRSNRNYCIGGSLDVYRHSHHHVTFIDWMKIMPRKKIIDWKHDLLTYYLSLVTKFFVPKSCSINLLFYCSGVCVFTFTTGCWHLTNHYVRFITWQLRAIQRKIWILLLNPATRHINIDTAVSGPRSHGRCPSAFPLNYVLIHIKASMAVPYARR